MKRVLALAALATISACATGSSYQEMRREAAATASSDASRPQGGVAVAVSGEGVFSRPSISDRVHGGAYNMDGRVAGVGDKSVRIQPKGITAEDLKITDDTRVLLDGQSARLGDVHEGDEVRATIEMRGETPTATELRVTPGAAKK